jgi:asparagine synthase (glutamine-hydrolysing)
MLRDLPNTLGLSALEVATGFAFGDDPGVEPLPAAVGSPRLALEAVIIEALGHDPCCVAFSGGRDSSAILALATHVARRDGLPLPIPVTQRYPAVPNTDESQWQELVIGHLQLEDWERIECGDELRMMGDVAGEAVRRHGPLYPCFAHVNVPTYRAAAGGCLLTGHGGDEFFDDRRMVRIRNQIGRVARRPSRSNLRSLAFNLVPHQVRRRSFERQMQRSEGMIGFPWLTVAARAEMERRFAAWVTDERLTWRGHLTWFRRRRSVRMNQLTTALLAGDHGVTAVDALYDPRVIAALARTSGVVGYRDRTDAYTRLFGDLLPSSILRRRTKAWFNGVFVTPTERRFAHSWDGDGLDPVLVDSDRLVAEWQKEYPGVGAVALLQLAWLRTDVGEWAVSGAS